MGMKVTILPARQTWEPAQSQERLAARALNREQGDEEMCDEPHPTPELQALVEQLGARDLKAAGAAEAALASHGEIGLAAVIWGLFHPDLRVRGACAAFMDNHGTDACFAALRQVALHDPAA